MAACAEVLKEDEFVVVSGRLQLDRFSGGLRMKVQQMWSLADARCRFARYLQVSVGEHMPDVPALLRQFPAKVEETENGNIHHGVKVRLDLICRDERGSASCELALGESSRFTPVMQLWLPGMARWARARSRLFTIDLWSLAGLESSLAFAGIGNWRPSSATPGNAAQIHKALAT